MIIEHINKFRIDTVSEIIKKSLEVLRTTDFSSQEEGRYDIEGDDLFYQVQEYETADRNTVESEIHKKYSDIQYIVSGKEAIGWSSANTPMDISSYNEEKDIAFFAPPSNETVLLMETGMAVFFSPYEIHRPRLQWEEGTACKIKKVVVKINWTKIYPRIT